MTAPEPQHATEPTPDPAPLAAGPWTPFLWSLGVALLVVLDGVGGLVVGLVVGLALFRGPTARRFLGLATYAFALLALEVLIDGVADPAQLSASWVLDNPLANHLGLAGFTFLVIGLLWDTVRRNRRP